MARPTAETWIRPRGPRWSWSYLDRIRSPAARRNHEELDSILDGVARRRRLTRNTRLCHEVFHSLGQRSQVKESYSIAACYTTFALAQWHPVRPLWYVDPEVAATLANTEIPTKLLQERALTLPFRGITLVMPPAFRVWNPHTGWHNVEAIHLARDTTYNLKLSQSVIDKARETIQAGGAYEVPPGDPAWSNEPTDSLLVSVVGESKGPGVDEFGADDAVQVFHLTPGVPVEPVSGPLIYAAGQPMPPHKLGMDAVRFVVNLLLALEGGYATPEQVLVPDPHKRKSQSKRRVLMRRRRLDLDAGKERTVIRLGARYHHAKAQAEARDTGESARAAPAPHWRLGHWHSYWVIDPETRPVYATRRRDDGKKLHLIAHLFPARWCDCGTGAPPQGEPEWRLVSGKQQASA